MALESPYGNLAAELSKLQAKLTKDLPKEIVDHMGTTTEQLAQSGIVEAAIKVGDKAPDFSLPDAKGKKTSLSQLLQRGPVVLTFYRGGWCPYCISTVNAMQKLLPEFEAKGATLVAVTPQLPQYNDKMIVDSALAFPVLSDVGLKISKEYGLTFTLDVEIQKFHTKVGVDVPSYNGDKTFQLPLPATYVIAQDGTVTYAFVNADYTKRAEPEEVLKAIPEP